MGMEVELVLFEPATPDPSTRICAVQQIFQPATTKPLS